jgi:hypothetical protein
VSTSAASARESLADPDLATVEKVLAGDVSAFEEIVRRWQGPMVNMAWRYCRDRGRAEELAQEALPGFIVVACASGWCVVELVRESLPAMSAAGHAPVNISIAELHPLEGAGWAALALSSALVSWLLSRRLAGSSGLF